MKLRWSFDDPDKSEDPNVGDETNATHEAGLLNWPVVNEDVHSAIVTKPDDRGWSRVVFQLGEYGGNNYHVKVDVLDEHQAEDDPPLIVGTWSRQLQSWRLVEVEMDGMARPDADGDLVGNTFELALDADDDGRYEDIETPAVVGNTSEYVPPDTDGDHLRLPDYRDNDHDNDLIPDTVDSFYTTLCPDDPHLETSFLPPEVRREGILDTVNDVYSAAFVEFRLDRERTGLVDGAGNTEGQYQPALCEPSFFDPLISCGLSKTNHVQIEIGLVSARTYAQEQLRDGESDSLRHFHLAFVNAIRAKGGWNPGYTPKKSGGIGQTSLISVALLKAKLWLLFPSMGEPQIRCESVTAEYGPESARKIVGYTDMIVAHEFAHVLLNTDSECGSPGSGCSATEFNILNVPFTPSGLGHNGYFFPEISAHQIATIRLRPFGD